MQFKFIILISTMVNIHGQILICSESKGFLTPRYLRTTDIGHPSVDSDSHSTVLFLCRLFSHF